MSLEFLKTMRISTGGMRAQAGRMRVVAENIANANSTGETPGADPYRRKIPSLKASFDRELQASKVALGAIKPDNSDFKTRYDPSHPAANAQGYVKMPNVNQLIEVSDMQDAQRAYEANVNVVSSTRRMLQRTIDLLRA